MLDLLLDLKHDNHTYQAGERISPSAIGMTPAQAERLVSAGAAVPAAVEEPGEAAALQAAAAVDGHAIDVAVGVAAGSEAGIEADGKPDADGLDDTVADTPASSPEAVADKTPKKRG